MWGDGRAIPVAGLAQYRDAERMGEVVGQGNEVQSPSPEIWWVG